MHLTYRQDMLLRQGAGITTLYEVREKSLEEMNWTGLSSWSSQIKSLGPFTIAIPCFLGLQELAGV